VLEPWWCKKLTLSFDEQFDVQTQETYYSAFPAIDAACSNHVRLLVINCDTKVSICSGCVLRFVLDGVRMLYHWPDWFSSAGLMDVRCSWLSYIWQFFFHSSGDDISI